MADQRGAGNTPVQEFALDAMVEVVEMANGLDKAGAMVLVNALRLAWSDREELRSLLHDIAVARRGDCPDVDEGWEKLPDEIRRMWADLDALEDEIVMEASDR